ncbi:MAG: ArnT family glycosyltransferase, partial [Candidatus Hodarchaeota archaeon]
MFNGDYSKELPQSQQNKLISRYRFQIFGYFVVFLVYLLTHLINLIEYPAFSTDEMFYVSKAICWEENGIPCVRGWGGVIWPEYTNPATLSWLLIILFGVFGTSPFVLRSFMLAIGLFNLLFVFLIGRQLEESETPWRGFWIGIIAGLVLALDQELVFFSRIGYLDNPMNLCLTIFLYLYLKYLKTDNLKFAWLAGLAAGLSLWFKLSAFFILIGLGIFFVVTRQIDGVLRVQAMMAFFVALYVQWGLSIDPIAFANGTVYQITKNYDANPVHFWTNVVYGDYIRMLILFSLFIPVFFYRNQETIFYKGSLLVFSLFIGAVVFFSLTRSLFNYYFAGFASYYSILFAISIFIAFDIGKSLYYELLQISGSIPRFQNFIKQQIRVAIILALFFTLFLGYHKNAIPIKSRYPPEYLNFENQEYLDIISYVRQNISEGETIIAPIEIGPWLNGSGYSVWNTWLNASTPDWVVREYIQDYLPSYLILHIDYLYISQGL